MQYSNFSRALNILADALAKEALLNNSALLSPEVESALNVLDKNEDSQKYVTEFRKAIPGAKFEDLRRIYKEIDMSVTMSVHKYAGLGRTA